VDVPCYYSPEFTSTLLSDADILKTAARPSDYKSQYLHNYFDINGDELNKDIANAISSLDKLYTIASSFVNIAYGKATISQSLELFDPVEALCTRSFQRI